MTGARDPREVVKDISSELDAAGFEIIVGEVQAQIDKKYN